MTESRGPELTDPSASPGPDATGAARDHVASVVKAMQLLDCFSLERPQLALRDFIQATGWTKATTYRLLAALEQSGWLLRTTDRSYRLSLKPFELGAIATGNLDVRREAEPIMNRLSAEIEDDIYLVVLDQARAICVKHVESTRPVRLRVDVGRSRTLNLGAGPLVLLAYGGPDLLEKAIAGGLDRMTDYSITDPVALSHELDAIRSRGYSVQRDDVSEGLVAVGAPVFDRSGAIAAALSITAMTHRLKVKRLTWVRSTLVGAAAELSARLGWSPGATARA